MAQDYRSVLCALVGQKNSVTDEVLNSAVSAFQDKLVNYKETTDQKLVDNQTLINSLQTKADKHDEVLAANQTLQNNLTAANEELVNYDMNHFAAVISNKDEMRKQLLNSRPVAIATLRTLKATVPAPAPVVPKAPLHNSKNAATPPALGTAPAVIVNSMDSFSPEQSQQIMVEARKLQGTGKFHNFHSAFLAAKNSFVRNANQ